MPIYNWTAILPADLAETAAATLARLGVSFQMERTESGEYVTVATTCQKDYELVVSFKDFDPASEVFEGQQYVVVNVTRNMWPALLDDYPGEFPVMPGEEPHTYGLLRNAASGLYDLIGCEDHTPETAPIFSLIPVPLGWVEAALKKIDEEEREEDDVE